MAVKRRPKGRPQLAGPGVAGSFKEAKKALEKNKSNAQIRNIPDTGIVVRFLDEPHEMNGYYEHWMKDGGPRPCIEGGDCEGCNSDSEDERRRSYRYLANAYVVDDQVVRALKIPKTVYEALLGYYEKKGTILDRDYELTKKGSGKEGTSYLTNPDSPQRINLSRFKKLNLEEILYSMLGFGSDEDDEEEEDEEYEEETRRRPKSTKKRRPVYDDEDEDDEDDYDDEEEERPRRRRAVKKTAAKRVVKKKSSGMDEFHRSTTRNPAKKSTTSRRIKRTR